MTRRKVYLAAQAVVCIALAVLLSAAAVRICREGLARKAEHPVESIYTPEIVSEKIAPIVPLFFAGAGLLAAGLVPGIRDEREEKPVKDARLARDLLAERVARPSPEMVSERRMQRKLSRTGWGLFALCMVPVFVYILNPAHFPQDDLEGMFYGLLRGCLPWAAVGLGALSVTSVLQEKSIVRETLAAQERLKEEKAESKDEDEAEEKAESKGEDEAEVKTDFQRPFRPQKQAGRVQAVMIVAAVVLMIAGALNGSARDVLFKAITICTECVGLG